MYAQVQGRTAPEGECRHFRQILLQNRWTSTSILRLNVEKKLWLCWNSTFQFTCTVLDVTFIHLKNLDTQLHELRQLSKLVCYNFPGVLQLPSGMWCNFHI